MPIGVYFHTPRSEETKRKISLSSKGRRASEETRKKLKVAQFMEKV